MQFGPKPRILQRGRSEDLLLRPCGNREAQRWEVAASGLGQDALCPSHHLSLVRGTRLTGQFQLVERSSDRLADLLQRGEGAGKHTTGPGPDLIDKPLLGGLRLRLRLDEGEDRAALLRLSVFLMRGGETRGLDLTLPGPEQQNHDVRPPHPLEAGLLGGLRGRTEVLRPLHLVSEDSGCPRSGVPVGLEPSHHGADEDLHRARVWHRGVTDPAVLGGPSPWAVTWPPADGSHAGPKGSLALARALAGVVVAMIPSRLCQIDPWMPGNIREFGTFQLIPYGLARRRQDEQSPRWPFANCS